LDAGNRLTEIDVGSQTWLDSAVLELGKTEQQIVGDIFRQLFQKLCDEPNNLNIRSLWCNYVQHTYIKVVTTIWRKLPDDRRSLDKFKSLLSDCNTLSSRDQKSNTVYSWINSPNRLFTSFSFQQSPHTNPHNALDAWAYRTVRFALFSHLQTEGDPYAGLSDLGVVRNSHTTYSLLRESLATIDIVQIINLDRLDGTELTQHLAGSIDLQIEQCDRLVHSVNAYLQNCPLAINQLNDTHFSEIGVFYLQRLEESGILASLSSSLSGSAVKSLLKSIGRVVRKYVGRVDNLLPLELNENNCSECASIFNSIEDELPSQLFSELHNLTDIFCQNFPDTRRSHQQILCLRYLLKLNMTQTGKVVKNNFGGTDNAGSAALWVNNAHAALVRSIHRAMNNSESILIEDDAINAAIDYLRIYFSCFRNNLLNDIANQLNIRPPVILDRTQRNEFISLVAYELEQRSALNLRDLTSQAAISQIIDRFLSD